jgi:hypothetical protein
MAVFMMRGEFNLLLPANIPVLTWVSAASASPGQTLGLTIVGQNTNFVNGLTQVNAGGGITRQQYQRGEWNDADRSVRGRLRRYAGTTVDHSDHGQ